MSKYQLEVPWILMGEIFNMDHDEFNIVYLQLLLSEFFCWLRCNRLWRFILVYSKIILLIRQS